MKSAALLLSAMLMTVGGAWVQAQSTTNVNQTGNHVNNQRDPGQQTDHADKVDSKGKTIRPLPKEQNRKAATEKHRKQQQRHAKPKAPPGNTDVQSPSERPAHPSVPLQPLPPMPQVPPTIPATMQ